MKIYLLIVLIIFGSCELLKPKKWYKGNLHTHSLWSDGNDFPEMILDWYKSNGYHFVALSDHNILPEQARWLNVHEEGIFYAYENYKKRFEKFVEERIVNDTLQVRLKPKSEYVNQFNKPGRFLILNSEEITDYFENNPIHLNATNIQEFIKPQGGISVADVMQNNIDAVLAQRGSLNVPVMPHLNHPNYKWAVTTDDIISLQGEKFFEIYNGHPYVNNAGDSTHPSVEKMWDIVLTERIRQGKDIMYGLATDDAHHYHSMQQERANPGRGWIYVKAEALEAEALINAMEQGDFYASSGVKVADYESTDSEYFVEIKGIYSEDHTIEFVGTLKGAEKTGTILQSTKASKATYQFSGDELYVRVLITSPVLKYNPNYAGEFERAWLQPVVIK